MAGQEYMQRPEDKQIWTIYIGILTETSQNPQKQALNICLRSACIPSFSLVDLIDLAECLPLSPIAGVCVWPLIISKVPTWVLLAPPGLLYHTVP